MADATLKLNKTAIKNRRKKLQKAQNYLDNELVKLMTPLVPVALKKYYRHGAMLRSMTIAEPGKIVFKTKEARHGYYSKANHAHGGNPKAKRRFFEVVKAKDGARLLAQVAKISGAKAVDGKLKGGNE